MHLNAKQRGWRQVVVANEEMGRSLYFSEWNWCNDSDWCNSPADDYLLQCICTKSATYLEHLSLPLQTVFCLLFSRVSAVRALPWKCQLHHTVPGNCHLRALCSCAFTLIEVFLPFLIKLCSATHAHLPEFLALALEMMKMKAVSVVYFLTFSNCFIYLF